MPRRLGPFALSALLALVLSSTNAADRNDATLAKVDDDKSGGAAGHLRPRHERRRRQRRRRRRTALTTTTTTSPQRDLATDCKSYQRPFVLNFQTDSYGSETSWSLRNDDSNAIVGSGPPEGVNYGSFALYTISYCLDVGSTYTLAMEDDFGDGMCCERGRGGYEYRIDDVLVYTSALRRTFDDYVEHTFTVRERYTPSPTTGPTTASDGGGDGVGAPAQCIPSPSTCGCDDVLQSDYRGAIYTTASGLKCQSWDEQSPHAHEYSPESYPNAGLFGNNHCRSPDGIDTPWCFTIDPNVEWEYCRVPSCPTVEVSMPTYMPTTGEETSTTAPTNEPSTASPTESPSISPTYVPTRKPTPSPTPDYSVYNPLNGCNGGDSKVTVEVRADEFSEDTSYELVSPNGTTVFSRSAGSYGMYEYTIDETCLPHGMYDFVIKDAYGDGMCCRYGEGFFRVHVDGKEVLNGGSYNDNVTASINVGYDPTGWMTERDVLYLEAHNVRRKEWHERYNLTYVPLSHSPELARLSKAWAEELLYACEVVGIQHEDNNPYGENLAKNTGNPDTWGKLYPPDNIVGRWVEFEIGLPYPSNGHLTQALWRASKHVGCGESVRDFQGGVCRVQVCRYSRAGNCDMAHYNATEGENWLPQMLANYTRCGPDCPPEGCN